jgi:cytochrome c oxidase subunit 1
MAIAVPTGVKIFNWIGTIWGGHLQMRTPMMFALGFIWLFMIGGFSGVMHAAAPADAQQHNSYFVVAHFHYVLIGGSLFGLLAGIHYWFPLMFGRKVSEFWGKLSFWLIFIGFNVTFFPMHFLGLNGMPRRTFTYDANMGWNVGNWSPRSAPSSWDRRRGLLRHDDLHLLQGREGGAGPVGRPHAGVEPAEPAPGVQLPRHPDRPRPRRLVVREAPPRGDRQGGAEHAKAEEAHGGIHMPFQSIYPFMAGVGILIGASASP